jgi:hypothetical protein
MLFTSTHIMGFGPPFKYFKDLGLGMNLQSIFTLHFLLNSCTFPIGCMPFHISYWLHVDYIGNAKDSILSSRSFEIHPKSAQKWFTSEFVPSQTHMLILYYSTLTNS